MAFEIESHILEGSEASGVEREASFAGLGTPVPTAATVEPSLPTPDLFMEHTQPSPLLAITQGGYLM